MGKGKIGDVPGLVIDNPGKFAKSCAKSLREALDNGRVYEKKPERLPENATKYEFQDTSRVCIAREPENQTAVSVIPLEGGLVREPWLPQWLAVSISFRHAGPVARLTAVDLAVYSGLFSDEAKELRFRAEWDIERAALDHAQPHWHVHGPPSGRPAGTQSPGAGFAAFPASPGPSFLTGTEELAPRIPDSIFYRIHYAMASGWHAGGQASIEDIQQDMICQWLGGCIRYIRGQMQFLRDRA